MVVAILGLLAAIALPAFMGYKRRASTSEVPQNLNVLFKTAAALYMSELQARGSAAVSVRSCVASPTALSPTPHSYKQKFSSTGGFQQLNFDIGDPIYYGYGISSLGAVGSLSCLGASAPNGSIYTFYANGNLDDDATLSVFELTVAADQHNQLYRSAGFYISHEDE